MKCTFMHTRTYIYVSVREVQENIHPVTLTYYYNIPSERPSQLVFSWWPTCPLVKKSIAKVLNQKIARLPKCFTSSFSSDGLVQNCMTLSQWFSHKTAALFTEQCTSSLLFHNFEVLKTVWTGHWRTMASLAMRFSKLLFKNIELEIQLNYLRLCAPINQSLR